MQTWSEMITYQAERRQDRVFLADPTDEVTYEGMRARMARRADWLAQHGARPGDRVAVLGRNSPALIEVLLACQHLGAISVPLNFRLAAAELGYVLAQSGSILLAADGESAELAAQACRAAGDAPALVGFGPSDDLISLDEHPGVRAGAEDACRIVYTSGTTSRPKGVVVNNGGVYAKCVQQTREFGYAYHEHGLLVGPLCHVAGLDVTLTNVSYVGGSLRVLRRFDPRETLAALVHERVAHVWLAPVMLARVVEAAEQDGVVLSGNPRLIIGGGEPTPRELLDRFKAVFPNTWYANVYGLTETGTGDTVLHAHQMHARAASVGLPVSGADVRVLDADGKPCPRGVAGQVAIGGAKLSPGYWQDSAATAGSRLSGRFLTGDAGYFDEQGYLFLAGRFKDMIVSGGENIAAAEVEQALLAHPDVRDAAVVGRPDSRWGEVPVAFVVLADGAQEGSAWLAEHCRGRLGRLKVPRDYVVVDELPRTAIGKVRKGLLRDRAREGVGRPA